MIRKISIFALPLMIILIYVIFGLSYYSVITSVIFSTYLLILFVMGGFDKKISSIIIGVFTGLILGFQWYSINMTLEWLNSPNYGESWSFGTDFLVIISWLLLMLLISVLYYRAFKKID